VHFSVYWTVLYYDGAIAGNGSCVNTTGATHKLIVGYEVTDGGLRKNGQHRSWCSHSCKILLLPSPYGVLLRAVNDDRTKQFWYITILTVKQPVHNEINHKPRIIYMTFDQMQSCGISYKGCGMKLVFWVFINFVTPPSPNPYMHAFYPHAVYSQIRDTC